MFEDGEELGEMLVGIGADPGRLEGMRKGVEGIGCWEAEWDDVVGDLF